MKPMGRDADEYILLAVFSFSGFKESRESFYFVGVGFRPNRLLYVLCCVHD